MRAFFRTRHTHMVLFAGCLALASAGAQAANTADATIALVGTCVACHGADGIGKAPQYPNLAGQHAAYLEKQLRDFRSGARQDSSMNPLAAPLTDENIAVLSAFFANLD